jgi:hypothetical protein
VEITIDKIAGTSPDRSEFYAYLTRGDEGSWGARLYRGTDRFGNSLQTREIAVAAAWSLGLIKPPIDEPLAVMPYYGPKREQPAPVRLKPFEKPITLADLAAQGAQRVEAERQRIEDEARRQQDRDRRRADEREQRRRQVWQSLCGYLSTLWPADLLARLDLDSHPDFSGGLDPKDPLIEVRVRGFFGGNLETWGSDGDHSALFASVSRDAKGSFKVESYRCWDRSNAALDTTDLAIALAFVTGKVKGEVPGALKG